MRRRGFIPPWLRARRVLGLNARNLLYVHGLNARRHFPLADDKVLAKSTLAGAGVPVPETMAVLSNLIEVSRAASLLREASEFVVKPARGRQGSGILVVDRHEAGWFHTAGGAQLSWDEVRRSMGDILFGVHSLGQSDRVLVERRIRAHRALGALGESGLPDIRIILLRSVPVMAMMRVPTPASGGRANLHQGAIGIGLRMADGLALNATSRRGSPEHSGTGAPVRGFHMPMWKSVIDVAERAARAVPLQYLGVDVVLDDALGPVVMELNVRPGLEIQNVNRRGMRRRLERIEAVTGGRA